MSDRDVEQPMAGGSVRSAEEAVRYWCRTFGQVSAQQLQCRPSDALHYGSTLALLSCNSSPAA